MNTRELKYSVVSFHPITFKMTRIDKVDIQTFMSVSEYRRKYNI